MAKNRKSQSVAVRFGPAIKAVVICLLIGGSGVGYVWQKEQIVRLGQEKHKMERKLQVLENRNAQLRNLLGDMRSPGSIQKNIANTGLGQPQQSQIWTLSEPGPDSPEVTPQRQREYALGSTVENRH